MVCVVTCLPREERDEDDLISPISERLRLDGIPHTD